jgi:hypothetical protein
MKAKLVLILIFISISNSFTQTKEWITYDLDSIIFLDFPFDVYEIDSIIDSRKTYKLYSNNGSSSFIAQKFYFDEHSTNVEIPSLPQDLKSLKTFYLDFIYTLSEISEYNMTEFESFKLEKLTGYKIKFRNEKNILAQKMFLLYINKNFYIFSYTNSNGIKDNDGNIFFNSIRFDQDRELQQFSNQSNYSLKIIFLLLIVLLVSSFILSLYQKRKT